MDAVALECSCNGRSEPQNMKHGPGWRAVTWSPGCPPRCQWQQGTRGPAAGALGCPALHQAVQLPPGGSNAGPPAGSGSSKQLLTHLPDSALRGGSALLSSNMSLGRKAVHDMNLCITPKGCISCLHAAEWECEWLKKP